MSYSLDFSGLHEGYGALLDGLLITLQLTVAANAMGVTLGFVLALFVMSPVAILRVPTMLMIEFFRCTPAIIQIVWFFYCLPIVFDVYMEPLTMGILALGLNLSAFNAEAYRAAIQAVPKEQHDAAIALGLGPLARIVHIVLPHAVRSSIPVLITNGIGTFQQTALVAIIAIQDLMYQGKTLATNTYRPIETFTLIALIYFAVSFPVSQIVQWFERRHAPVRR